MCVWLTGTGTGRQVYMQPGEMVLYEGARIHHGRPMRLKGNEFGACQLIPAGSPVRVCVLDRERVLALFPDGLARAAPHLHHQPPLQPTEAGHESPEDRALRSRAYRVIGRGGRAGLS